MQIKGLTKGNLKVINMIGEVVLEKAFSTSFLDLSELSDGIYFLHIQSGEKWASQKFVKQKF